MNKTLKHLLDLVIGSILVWGIVILVFKSEVFFGEKEVPVDPNEIPADAVFLDGVYQGSAKGHNATITVEVTITDGKISSVEILEHSESPDISDKAIDQIPKSIVEKNSLEVDGITGATVTSRSIVRAVKDALLKSIAPKE